MEQKQGNRKQREGVVVSDAMDKTIVVRVQRRFPHPQYGKIITRHAKFTAHDERGEAHNGDRVLIEETRPLSKTKRWRLVQVLVKGPVAAAHGAAESEVAS